MTEFNRTRLKGGGVSVPVLRRSPRLPFDDSEVHRHVDIGRATLRRRDGGLFLNDHRLIIWKPDNQRFRLGTLPRGSDLLHPLTGKSVVNANADIMDALYDHPELAPRDWRKSDQGRARRIYFWGTVFQRADRREIKFVGYLSFIRGRAERGYTALREVWGLECWAASLECSVDEVDPTIGRMNLHC